MFLFVNEEGISFGAQYKLKIAFFHYTFRPHYGLWINNELTKGRSFECETFNNQLLSYKNDFEIMKLEVLRSISDLKDILGLGSH